MWQRRPPQTKLPWSEVKPHINLNEPVKWTEPATVVPTTSLNRAFSQEMERPETGLTIS